MQADNRSVLVTGASSGIGAYVARQLKAEGWSVIATARKQKDLEALRADGLTALYLDYAEPDSIQACADEVLEMTGGKLWGLFHNGGFGQPGAVEDVPIDALRYQFEVNVFGYVDLTQKLLPAMLERNEGRIIVHSSVLGFTPMRWSGPYNGTKFALEGLFLTMRNELKNTGVEVSLLQTGPVESLIGQNSIPYYDRWIADLPSRHKATYEARLKELRNPSDKGIGGYRRGPEVVHRRVVHALTSSKPKPRYFITHPTYILGFLQRILTSRAFSAVAGAGR